MPALPYRTRPSVRTGINPARPGTDMPRLPDQSSPRPALDATQYPVLPSLPDRTQRFRIAPCCTMSIRALPSLPSATHYTAVHLTLPCPALPAGPDGASQSTACYTRSRRAEPALSYRVHRTLPSTPDLDTRGRATPALRHQRRSLPRPWFVDVVPHLPDATQSRRAIKARPFVTTTGLPRRTELDPAVPSYAGTDLPRHTDLTPPSRPDADAPCLPDPTILALRIEPSRSLPHLPTVQDDTFPVKPGPT